MHTCVFFFPSVNRSIGSKLAHSPAPSDAFRIDSYAYRELNESCRVRAPHVSCAKPNTGCTRKAATTRMATTTSAYSPPLVTVRKRSNGPNSVRPRFLRKTSKKTRVHARSAGSRKRTHDHERFVRMLGRVNVLRALESATDLSWKRIA